MRVPRASAIDRFTRAVGLELDAPVVCVSLLDDRRRLLTSAIGLPASVALLQSWSFARRVASTRPLLIPDAKVDPVVARWPTVRDGAVAAYLGIRLTARDGRPVGTLSVMDTKPRSWTPAHLASVRRLCEGVIEAGVETETSAATAV